MRIIALAILAIAPIQAHAAYGIDAQKAALACTWATIKEIPSAGPVRVVLPGFIPGNHLRAGQWVDENCQVRP